MVKGKQSVSVKTSAALTLFLFPPGAGSRPGREEPFGGGRAGRIGPRAGPADRGHRLRRGSTPPRRGGVERRASRARRVAGIIPSSGPWSDLPPRESGS